MGVMGLDFVVDFWVAVATAKISREPFLVEARACLNRVAMQANRKRLRYQFIVDICHRRIRARPSATRLTGLRFGVPLAHNVIPAEPHHWDSRRSLPG